MKVKAKELKVIEETDKEKLKQALQILEKALRGRRHRGFLGYVEGVLEKKGKLEVAVVHGRGAQVHKDFERALENAAGAYKSLVELSFYEVSLADDEELARVLAGLSSSDMVFLLRGGGSKEELPREIEYACRYIWDLPTISAQKMVELIRKYNEGTADKTQGQEADLVIYGFTVADDSFAEKVSEFIFNPNRFNVAVTRTKELLVVISSSSVTQAAMSTISTSYKFMAEDMRTAYYKLHPAYRKPGMSLSTQDILKILTGINSSKGAYMFQELVRMMNNKIGELYLPVQVVNGNLFSAGKLTNRPPSSPHATIRFYTI